MSADPAVASLGRRATAEGLGAALLLATVAMRSRRPRKAVRA